MVLGEHADDLDDVASEELEELARAVLDADDLEASETADKDADEALREVIDRIHTKEDLRPYYDDIVEEAADYFVTYVGKVDNLDPVVSDVTPDSSVGDLTELQQYHFLRTGVETDADRRDEVDLSDAQEATETTLDTPVGVRDFVSLLPDRLRTVDTAVTREHQTFEGEIHGRIDWQRTIKRQMAAGGADTQQYVCRVPDREALSARNRVLLDFLDELDEIATRFERHHANGGFPDWLDGWGENGDLRETVQNGLDNAHFAGVDTESISATPREVTTVRRDRDPLYREAAELLDHLRQIKREQADEEDAEDLLRMDVFKPDEDEDSGGDSTVYELYWIFRLLKTLDNSDGLQLLRLNPDSDLVAAWTDDDSRYLLFNDWDGTADLDGVGDGDGETEFVRFAPPDTRVDAGPDPSSPRTGYDYQARLRLREGALDKSPRDGSDDEDGGTPDVVLVELDATADEPTIRGLFVGEVKHTNSNYTLDEGIDQLVEYGVFAEVGEDAQVAGEPEADYVATDPDFLTDDRLELGLFTSSGYQAEGVPDEIQFCWFDDPKDAPDSELERPLK